MRTLNLSTCRFNATCDLDYTYSELKIDKRSKYFDIFSAEWLLNFK